MRLYTVNNETIIENSLHTVARPLITQESTKLKEVPKITYEEFLQQVEKAKSAEHSPDVKKIKTWRTSNLLGEFGLIQPLLLGRLRSYDAQRCKYWNTLRLKIWAELIKIRSHLISQEFNPIPLITIYNSYYYRRNIIRGVSTFYIDRRWAFTLNRFLLLSRNTLKDRDTLNWYLVTGNAEGKCSSLLPIVTPTCWNLAHLSQTPFRHFNHQFLKREKIYTKLKYSRSPQYDIVSGGVAALFSGFLGFLISEKFGIELVDSGDFYVIFMYIIFLVFSAKPVLRLVNKFDNLTPIVSLVPLYVTLVGLLTFTCKVTQLWLKTKTLKLILFFKIN